MAKLELIATATFGLEAVVKREIEGLGYKILKSEDGKITFLGNETAIARANLWLRCADRVLLKMGEFQAFTFTELFEQTKALPWEEWIPLDGKFTVSGTSVKSKLFSVPDCQSIVKKAVVEKLKETYPVEHFEETGAEYNIKVTLLKDRATLTIDTSGTGLHILCLGSFEGKGRRKGAVEVYGQGRFFTVTGRPFGEAKPIRDASVEIVQIIEQYIDSKKQTPKHAERPQREAARPALLSGQALIQRIRRSKNGAAFEALYDRGDT
ncbi:MAG: hypothetical protein IJC26_00670, partial [Clostridia bacterium]|nr:hypothetical protein [Clostridia bacterium]